MISPKQAKVLNWFRDHETITMPQAVELIGGNLYANAAFHVGNVLRRMVERGWLVRVRRGCYSIPQKAPIPSRVCQATNLGELFEPGTLMDANAELERREAWARGKP